jgi:type I restriction enzyme S subunit
MKKDWQIKTLAEVCLIKPPKSEARAKFSPSTPVSFLPMEDLGVGLKFARANKSRPLSTVVGSYTYFADGDVLLAKITPCFENGKLGIADGLENGVGFGSSEYFVLRPDSSVSNEWLYYFLDRETFLTEGGAQMTGAVGHKRVPKEFIESCSIPVPPLPEQQRIVALLDEAFAGLATAQAHAERNLRNARTLFESHLDAVFTQRGEGWVEHSLGDLIEIQNGYAFKSSEYTDSGHFVIRIGNVQDGEITLTNPRFIKLRDEKLKRFVLNEGDILVSLTGNIGRVGVIQGEHLPAVLNQRVARIGVEKKKCDRGFLFRFLLSRKFRESLQKSGHGAAQQNVSTKEIETVRLSLPGNNEQRRLADDFANFEEETQRLTRLYEQKLAALEALKKSLLHQAFSGEL